MSHETKETTEETERRPRELGRTRHQSGEAPKKKKLLKAKEETENKKPTHWFFMKRVLKLNSTPQVKTQTRTPSRKAMNNQHKIEENHHGVRTVQGATTTYVKQEAHHSWPLRHKRQKKGKKSEECALRSSNLMHPPPRCTSTAQKQNKKSGKS